MLTDFIGEIIVYKHCFCYSRETRESFASITYVLLAGTLISIGDVSLSIVMASIHYVTVCVSP